MTEYSSDFQDGFSSQHFTSSLLKYISKTKKNGQRVKKKIIKEPETESKDYWLMKAVNIDRHCGINFVFYIFLWVIRTSYCSFLNQAMFRPIVDSLMLQDRGMSFI